MGVIVASKVDPILMVDGKSPGPHFRGEGAVELPHLTRIGIDGKEKEGGIILSKGEINRIPGSRFSRADVGPPADGFPNRGAEVTEGKGSVGKTERLIKVGDKENEWAKEESFMSPF